VREDTTELILNLKQVRLKSYSDEPVNVRLEVVGPGVVTAGDIQVPPEVEVVNPELALATLNDQDSRLDVLLTIEKGRGYLSSDGRESPSIGVIPIDAVFSPIRRVNYRVEKTRVGARTDYDKLMLAIQTDGTIDPKEALAQGAQILIDQFQVFAQLVGPIRGKKDGGIGPGPIPSRLQDMPIEILDLSSRTYNCLKRSQITTVGQLLQMSEDELLGLRNFGQKSLVELHEKLAEHGIETASDSGSTRRGGDEDLDDGPDDDEDVGTLSASGDGGVDHDALIADGDDEEDR
jgi:DNA-directed RNA polymerase subunit alpha